MTIANLLLLARMYVVDFMTIKNQIYKSITIPQWN